MYTLYLSSRTTVTGRGARARKARGKKHAILTPYCAMYFSSKIKIFLSISRPPLSGSSLTPFPLYPNPVPTLILVVVEDLDSHQLRTEYQHLPYDYGVRDARHRPASPTVQQFPCVPCVPCFHSICNCHSVNNTLSRLIVIIVYLRRASMGR